MQNAQSAAMFSATNLLIYVIAFVFSGFCIWKIAQKLDVKDPWIGWIPIANLYTLVQCADVEVWWIILLIIPCVNFFTGIYVWWKITERLGKPGAASLLLLVPCVNLGFMLWLALGD